MNFFEAMEKLREGKKIRKVSMPEKDHLTIEDDRIVLNPGNYVWYQKETGIDDDWEIYEEEPVDSNGIQKGGIRMNFFEAMEKLKKEGVKVIPEGIDFYYVNEGGKIKTYFTKDNSPTVGGDYINNDWELYEEPKCLEEPLEELREAGKRLCQFLENNPPDTKATERLGELLSEKIEHDFKDDSGLKTLLKSLDIYPLNINHGLYKAPSAGINLHARIIELENEKEVDNHVVKKLRKRVAELEKELGSVNLKMYNDSIRRNIELEGKVGDMEIRIAELENENSHLKDDCKFPGELETTKYAVDYWRDKYNKLVKKVSELESINADYRDEHIYCWKEKFNSIKKDNADLLNNFDLSLNRVAELEERVKDLIKKNVKLYENLEYEKDYSIQTAKKHIDTIIELEKKLEKLKTHSHGKENEVEDLLIKYCNEKNLKEKLEKENKKLETLLDWEKGDNKDDTNN